MGVPTTVTMVISDVHLWVMTAHVVVALLVGVGQIAVVWFGIHRMTRTGEQRERQHERRHGEVMDQSERRHNEAMAALSALIERTAPASRRRARDTGTGGSSPVARAAAPLP